MQYLATINTPGYLPDSDDLAVFDTAADAWAYLIDEYAMAWNDTDYAHGDEPLPPALKEAYDSGVAALQAATGEGSVTLATPGYDGDHDLGKAYTVTAREGVTCVDCGAAFADTATAQAHWDASHHDGPWA